MRSDPAAYPLGAAPPFLFIVGAPRSANSPTLATLDGHPDILAWPIEFPYFVYFNGVANGRKTVPIREINPVILAGLEVALNDKLTLDSGTDTPVFALGDTIGDLDTQTLIGHLDRDRDTHLGAVDYLKYLFESLKVAHATYVDRPVKYLLMNLTARGMDWENDRLMESSKFLFPYRDMVESYASIREKGLKADTPPQFFALGAKKGSLYWLQTFQRVSQLAERHVGQENFFVVSISRVRHEPEAVIADMCRFLEIEFDPAMSHLSIAGKRHGGNAYESALNKGTYAPRSSKLSIPLSSFEESMLASLDLYDFDEDRRLRTGFGPLAMARTAFTSAFSELYDRADSAWKGTGEPSSLLKRLKLSLRLAGVYFALRKGAISRLVPRRSSDYNLDSLDWSKPVAASEPLAGARAPKR